jgi:CBS domain-containing protein
MRVQEIMTPDPVCCTRETRIEDVARMMRERDCGGIPVVLNAGDRIPLGMVTDRDIIVRAVAQGQNPLGLTAGQVMTSPVVTVTTRDSLEECGRKLEENQVRRAPVVDGNGRCCGIVAQADLARRAPGSMTAEVVRSVSQPSNGTERDDDAV